MHQGGLHVSTGSGSFTLAIESIHSGEADTYFNTFKHLTEHMPWLVVPAEQVDDTLIKALLTFKELMTDRTIIIIFLKINSNIRGKKLFVLLLRFSICCLMLKEKQSATSTMAFVDCISHITLGCMPKTPFMSGKRLWRNMATCMVDSKILKSHAPTIYFLRFQSC